MRSSCFLTKTRKTRAILMIDTSQKALSQKNFSKHAAGFSLLELMVAMAVTLIITGAMFGMVTNAQTSFRREPALGDRQMQIRIAMDRIQEDLLTAGNNIGSFGQTFRESLNGVGPLGVRVIGDAALGGGNADALELRTQTQDCPSLVVPAGTGPNYVLAATETAALASATWPCYSASGFVLGTFLDGSTKRGWRDRTANPTGVNLITPADALSQLENANERNCNYRPATSPCTPAPAAPIPATETTWRVANFMSIDVIRYQIGLDTDGAPALFRSATGGLNTAGTFQAPTPALAQWQLVARGIEDLQIRYLAGPPSTAAWVNSPPTIDPVAATNYDGVIRQVEVTIWARTLGQANLQGATTPVGNLVNAVHGSLVTIVAPRPAQTVLSTAPSTNENRWQ